MLLEHQIHPGCLFCNPFFSDGLFGDLPPETLSSLDSIKRVRAFPADAEVFAAGERLRGIYILLKGGAQVILPGEGQSGGGGGAVEAGNDFVFASRPAARGEIFGLTQTLAGVPSRLTLRTAAPCVFEFIDERDLIYFLLGKSTVCFRLVRLLSLNLQKNCRPVSSSLF